MKKSLLALASIMILALCIFVSCTAEVADPYDGLTYVTFGGSPSKALGSSFSITSYDDLYWFYTAEKQDKYGTYGSATNVPVHEGHTGLSYTVGPFSQGYWIFTLDAYRMTKDEGGNDKKVLVYSGTTDVVSIKGQNVTVPVSVSPQGNNGSIAFIGAYFAWKDTTDVDEIPYIKIIAEGTKTNQRYTLSNKFNAIGGSESDAEIPIEVNKKDNNGRFYIESTVFDTVVADYYQCSVIAYTTDEDTPILRQTLGLMVYGSVTTVVTGDLTEDPNTNIDFSVAKQDITIFNGNEASVKVTPSGAKNENGESLTTSVGFGDALTTGVTHYLDVEVSSIESAVNKFTISDSNRTAVAGINLELVSVSSDGTSKNVTDFGGKVVTVTTYIEKGLSNVKVYYKGSVCDGSPAYDSTTGKLTFMTNHFSEFYAVSDSVAVNETTGKGYARLVDAFDNSVDGSSIKLLKDVVVDDLIDISRKTIVFDLAGKKVTIGSIVEREGGIIRVLGGGDLTINDSVGGGEIDTTSNRKMKNNSVHPSYNGSEPAVWTCVDVYPEVANNHLVNGNSKLTINGGTFKAHYYVVAGNGQSVDENSTIVAINGGSFESAETAIFHPQNGVLTIKDGNFKGEWSALEVRAGIVDISGGTFESTSSEYNCIPKNGNTTKGAAIAIAQHTTRLPIKVSISGGTFSGYHALSVGNPQGDKNHDNEHPHFQDVYVTASDGVFKTILNGNDIVKIDSYYSVSDDAIYADSAKFSVTAK